MSSYRDFENPTNTKGPLWKEKISVSDFDEIQNMEFLWLTDFTHEIWDESETFFFTWNEKKSSLILLWFFHLHQVLKNP